MPSSTVLVSGPAVGAAQTLICSYSGVFLPPMSTAVRTSAFSFVGALSVFLIYSIDIRVWLVDHVDLMAACTTGGKVWVLFLSHTAPGFQLRFYLHLCMWVVHWGLLLMLPWRTQVCSSEGQVLRWCNCLGCRDPGGAKCAGMWTASATGVRGVCQALKGAPWMETYSTVPRIRQLMRQPLYCSAAGADVRGEAMVMAPPPMHDSAVSLLPWLPGFPL